MIFRDNDAELLLFHIHKLVKENQRKLTKWMVSESTFTDHTATHPGGVRNQGYGSTFSYLIADVFLHIIYSGKIL